MAVDGQKVMLCCDNSTTAILDLQTETVSDIETKEDLYGGDIYNMKRHRLFDVVCVFSDDYEYEVRLLQNGRCVYKSRYKHDGE